VSYTIDSSSNRVTAIGGTSVAYDAAGQITAQTVSATPLTYAYDAAGRIETVSDSSGVLATYTYDAQNLRTKKVLDDGTTTHYVYGAGGLLSGEYDNTGGLIREYVYHYGEPVAQIDGGVSETLIYLHTDHLGTPRVASNTSGVQVWSWDSDAFGVGVPTGTAEVNLRCAGQYFDAESDLHYNWNRYYNPATGRYVSSDPIGLGGGINTYGYAGANPAMYVDPEGLFFFGSDSNSEKRPEENKPQFEQPWWCWLGCKGRNAAHGPVDYGTYNGIPVERSASNDPNVQQNCHGLSLGIPHIVNRDVKGSLRTLGYTNVISNTSFPHGVRVGDIILYDFPEGGEPEHSVSVVGVDDDGTIWVRSKNGTGPVFPRRTIDDEDGSFGEGIADVPKEVWRKFQR